MTNDRILNPGGFAAAFLCLVTLTGCPGPMQPGTDSGMPPDSDAGTPPDDADVPPPDSGMPPDGGMDVPDAPILMCTPDMMRDRITPPCDPDTRTGAGIGPTGLEGFVGPGAGWASASAGCSTGMESDTMSRIALGMHCRELDIEPYNGVFYYDRDGLWYANWQNCATQECARMSFDIHPEFGPQSATVELFRPVDGDTPYQTVLVAR